MGHGYERYIICIEGLMGVVGLCWCDVYVHAEEDGVGPVHQATTSHMPQFDGVDGN
jgi:hypothetical protein